MSVTIINH